MKNILMIEAKRVLYGVIITILVATGLLWTKRSGNEVAGLVQDYRLVWFTILGTYILLTILFASDKVRRTGLLYLHSCMKPKDILFGKFIVTISYTTLVTIWMVLMFNLKAMIVKEAFSLAYFRMNFDNYPLLLLDRSFVEWLYIPNLLLNFCFYYFVMVLFFSFFEFLQEKKREKYVDLVLSGVVVLAPAAILVLLAGQISQALPGVSFNRITPRIRAFELESLEVNFLSIPSVILVGLGFIFLLHLILKGWPRK